MSLSNEIEQLEEILHELKDSVNRSNQLLKQAQRSLKNLHKQDENKKIIRSKRTGRQNRQNPNQEKLNSLPMSERAAFLKSLQ